MAAVVRQISDRPPTLDWAVEWRPWLWRPALERTLAAVDDWTDLRVCEVGSRSGRLATYLAHLGAHVTGFDLTGVDLDPARALASSHGLDERVELLEYDGDTATIGETFDVVITKSVLVAMPPESAVHSVRRLVRDGGLYLGVENRRLPGVVNRLRNYDEFGLSSTHVGNLRREFASVQVRSTYWLVASIVAKA